MSSPLVTQFRRGGVSKDVRLTAATGALPLSPAEQIELLFLLTRDSDDAVSAQASTSLEAIDEASLISVLKEVSTPQDVLTFFGRRSMSDDVQESLVRNTTASSWAKAGGVVANTPRPTKTSAHAKSALGRGVPACFAGGLMDFGCSLRLRPRDRPAPAG